MGIRMGIGHCLHFSHRVTLICVWGRSDHGLNVFLYPSLYGLYL